MYTRLCILFALVLLSPCSLVARDSKGTVKGWTTDIKTKEFTGEQMFVLRLEQNFRSIPFLALNIPFLYKNFIEIITHASVAHSWTQSGRIGVYAKPTNGWYTEGGIGVSRILGLLRFDLTRRFHNPSGWHYTISVARIL